MKKKLFIFGLFLLPIALLTFSVGWSSKSEPKRAAQEELLKFSHKKHIQDAGLDCETCHEKAKTSTSEKDKKLPDHAVCTPCHGTEVDNKCDFCHTKEPEALPMELFDRELRFNHKYHLETEKLQCVTCHTSISDKTDGRVMNFPTMKPCESCHDDRVAPNACEKCHKNLASLWPESHTVANYKREHRRIVKTGINDNECQPCHKEAFCTQCHDGSNLTALTGKQSVGAIAPRTLGNDKALTTASASVHGENYSFTHGIDAKTKFYDCQTCHKSKSFCNECHNNGSGLYGTIKPLNHYGLGFVGAGIGTGSWSDGGSHRVYARRNIEECAACHDIEGKDPICMKCHIDVDGIRGTDPKTHEANYMKNISGDWMTDPSSKCFACHLDPNAKPNTRGGLGFCGYCHGVKK
jgi:hypothetical protein